MNKQAKKLKSKLKRIKVHGPGFIGQQSKIAIQSQAHNDGLTKAQIIFRRLICN